MLKLLVYLPQKKKTKQLLKGITVFQNANKFWTLQNGRFSGVFVSALPVKNTKIKASQKNSIFSLLQLTNFLKPLHCKKN